MCSRTKRCPVETELIKLTLLLLTLLADRRRDEPNMSTLSRSPFAFCGFATCQSFVFFSSQLTLANVVARNYEHQHPMSMSIMFDVGNFKIAQCVFC